MPKFTDLTGQTFGRLTVVGLAGRDDRYVFWHCRCECGNLSVVRGQGLTNGSTPIKSCGCLQREKVTTHGLEKHSLYHVWSGMMKRCYHPQNPKYKDYGGRGITVCERWKDIRNFIADLKEKPVGKSLDRYPDPDGNYEPNNVRWATPLEQRHNRRKKS